MSELKAYLCIQAREIENKTFSCYNQTLAVKNAPEATMAQVYLKDEADKVIALLTDKSNYNEYAYKRKSEEFADTCRFYEKEIRHHKYKRCLAMARWCEAEMWNIRNTPLCDMNTHEVWRHEDEFWQRWYEHWLKIAEQFKEAK